MNPIEELLIKTQMVDKELSALKITVQNLSHEVREISNHPELLNLY